MRIELNCVMCGLKTKPLPRRFYVRQSCLRENHTPKSWTINNVRRCCFGGNCSKNHGQAIWSITETTWIVVSGEQKLGRRLRYCPFDMILIILAIGPVFFLESIQICSKFKVMLFRSCFSNTLNQVHGLPNAVRRLSLRVYWYFCAYRSTCKCHVNL